MTDDAEPRGVDVTYRDATRRGEASEGDHATCDQPPITSNLYHCTRDKNLRYDYGVTCLDWARLLSVQGGTCAKPSCRVRRDLVLDEDHETGEVRALLCRRHNGDVAGWIVDLVRRPPGQELGIVVDLARTRRARLRKRRKSQPAPGRDRMIPRKLSVREELQQARERRKAFEEGR